MSFHAKYPSMERQDPTQAQLGAFKFTPVDEAVRQSTMPYQLLFQRHPGGSQNADAFQYRVSSPDMSGNPSFFDNQIKPSLGSSRLRLGPAAVRAAVESVALSPQKKFGHPAHVVPFQPGCSSSSEMDSVPSLYTSESNSAPFSDLSMHFTNANTSLLRALEAEQEAHELTKSRLEQQVHVHHEVEVESQRLKEHNKALLNSIKLLQSTVKHMVQKETDTVNEQQSKQSAQDMKPQAYAHDTSKSILYDLMATYKPARASKNGNHNLIQSDEFFEADKTDHAAASGTKESQRQFPVQSKSGTDDEVSKRATNPYRAQLEALLQADDEEPDEDDVSDSERENPLNAKQTSHHRDAGAAHSQDLLAMNESDSSTLRNGFTYNLPASFLSKYGKPRMKKDRISSAATDSEEAFVANLSLPNSPSMIPDNHSKTILMPDPLLINWKIDARNTNELKGEHVETRTNSHFEQHPVRYTPSLLENNLFRTVMMDFIPYGTFYSEVLDQIRGGTLEQIQLYGPIGDATDFVTARVIFVEERSASALYVRGQDPGIFIKGERVRVWQVLEPTYPKPKKLQEDIYENGHTRIIDINAPMVGGVEDVLKKKLRTQIEAGMVLDIGTTQDGYPSVEFTSIEEATKALARFVNDPDFAGADFDFADDPCAANYE